MGRPRQFDEERVVRAACRAFWTRGFDATSTADLCEATGLTRSSLYNTFHSKEHLFRRALSHYATTMTARQSDVLDTQGPSGLERLRTLLSAIVDDELDNQRTGHGSGCFTVNTITAAASRNPDIARLIQADQDRRLASLRLAIMDGQLDGSVTGEREPGELAWYTTSLIYGLRVAAQSGAGREPLEGIAGVGLRALQA
ncbi:TetR/AcrR family transcriptional regulator [Nocardiopsis sp. B62]|uniref:TetR/AcrR family transcriptional regulator n=1 Tax=Nocardiopsis sp. B62 TaxID=2824874 RepID=UPI001B3800A8|nr:TetR/AcrR family transcriptional regulator [Nocardiopsis sp. B62]MBQ1082777.1 TetR/AcrR family transcriptional regulator [Nocardiopsis sp. B62]